MSQQRADEAKVHIFLENNSRELGYYQLQFLGITVHPVNFILHLAEVDHDVFHVMLELLVRHCDRARFDPAEEHLQQAGYGRNVKRPFLHGEDLESLSEDLVQIMYDAAQIMYDAAQDLV